MPVSDVDDAQAAMAEGNASLDEEAFRIRAAMSENVAHAHEGGGVGRPM